MTDPTQPRRGYFGALFSVFVMMMVFYFSYAAVQGDYGILAMIRIEAQEQVLERELAGLRAERAIMENRTRRLSAEYLDLDLLDEQARKVLGLARGDEIVIR